MAKLILGQVIANKYGQSATITGLNKNRVTLLTEQGNTFDIDRSAVRNGVFKIRDIPTVCGVGFIGYGSYKSKSNGKHTNAYQSWRDMLRRCYDKSSVRFKSYGERGVTVCGEWHDFQNFASWYYNQHTVEGVKYHLDKDFNGSGCYSKETCVLVPHYLNASIVDTSKKNTKGFTRKGTNEHRVQISCFGEQYTLPNHRIENSTNYYNFFKKRLLMLVAYISLFYNHIDNNVYEQVIKYCKTLPLGEITTKMKETANILQRRVLEDNNIAVKLGIDNGVEIINVYWEDQRKRVEDWVNK